jgi:hypothetical protein
MFIGTFLHLICIGPWDLQFCFDRPPVDMESKTISVEGRGELRDGAGHLIDHSDRSRSNAEHEAFRLQALLAHAVTAARVDPPASFTLILGCE